MGADVVRGDTKANYSGEMAEFAPPGGFGLIADFAAAVSELQELRHEADYDPLFRIDAEEAKLVLKQARTAVDLFRESSEAQQKAFLFLLLFKPRG